MSVDSVFPCRTEYDDTSYSVLTGCNHFTLVTFMKTLTAMRIFHPILDLHVAKKGLKLGSRKSAHKFKLMELPEGGDSGQLDRDIRLAECIHRSEKTMVCRAIRMDNQERLIVKLEKGTDASPFYKEWMYGKKLKNTSCVVQYAGLGWHSGRPCLMMKEIPQLSSLETAKLSIQDVIRVGLQIADAIHIMHEKGVLHHSLSSRHILWDGCPDHPVRIIDFSNACSHSKHRVKEIDARLNINKLRWLSPEQLGRTNKEIDYRADFHALGAILYQMCTGTHHVTATDKADIIYSIMTGTIIEPALINDQIPPRLNKIIIKLLSKDAGDRYQSTYGIKYDLQLCLASMTTVGEKDILTTFQPPKSLYGRSEQKRRITEELERIVVDRTSDSVILISGVSGVGKTSLIRSTLQDFKHHHTYVDTKSDQYVQGTPYSSFCQLLGSLMKKILQLDAVELNPMKANLLRELGGKGKPLLDLLPEMENLIGMQPSVEDMGPNERYNRLRLLFHTFLSTFTLHQGLLIMYFDDIQWADDFSLKMMLDLLSDVIPQMVLIMTYRSGEIKTETDHLLEQMKGKRCVLQFELCPLTTSEIQEWMTSFMTSYRDDASKLSQVVHQKTAGIPYDITTFVSTLCDRGLLIFDHDLGVWMWDITKIQGMATMENATEMLTSRMELSHEIRSILSFAAIAGEQCDLDILTSLTGWNLQYLAKHVCHAVREGYLLMEGGSESILEFGGEIEILSLSTIKLRFSHDRVQRAAFDLISASDLPQFHLSIARILRLRMTSSLSTFSTSTSPDSLLFDCLTHYIQCEQLLNDIEERMSVCNLCDLGGQKAASNAAYSGANSYASLGIRLLPENSWETHYDVSLRLHKIVVRTEYLSERYAEAEKMYEDIITHCKSTDDKISLCRIQMEQYEQQNRFIDCLLVGVKCLAWLSHDVLPPTAEESLLKERLLIENNKLTQYLSDKQISRLQDLEEVTDDSKKEAQAICNLIWSSSYCIGHPIYCEYLSTYALNLTFSYGLSMESPPALCNFAFTRHDRSESHRNFDLASLAILLLKSRFPNERQSYRCQSVFACGISPRLMPLADSVSLLDFNFKVALDKGDVPYAAYICHQALTYRYLSGRPLREASDVYTRHVKFLEKCNPVALGFCLGITSPLRYHLGNDTLTEESFMLKNDNILNRGMWFIGKMQTLIWRDDVPDVEQMSVVDTALQFLPMAFGYTTTETLFCAGFILLRCRLSGYVSTLSEAVQKQTQERIDMVVSHVRGNTLICKVNNQHKLSILEAMISWVEGKTIDVISHLEDAAEQANEALLIQYEALANELSSQVWERLGKRRYVEFHQKEALRLYDIWGSKVKVSHLSSSQTVNHSSLGSPNLPELESMLDMEVVTKVTKVVTADMNLEQMLSAMLKLLIQNSAAQRVLFLLPDSEGELLLIAEGDSSGFTVNPLRVSRLSSLVLYPHHIINRVVKSQTQVIMERASEELSVHGIDVDPYIQTNHVKSVMCLPIVMNGEGQKGHLKGIIYLDNSLSGGVFNETRAKVVRIIASQMVVLLENAKFAQLLESEKRSKEIVAELEINRKSLEEFIDVLCHELRNPLNGIYGSKELLEENCDKLKARLKRYQNQEDLSIMKEIKELTDAISVSCDHLKEIVDTVLNSSKINSNNNQIELREIPFRPASVLRKVELMFHARIIEKGFNWCCNASEAFHQDFSVIGDPQRLSQILINLISNSIKFTQRGGVIVHCKCYRLDERIRQLYDISENWMKTPEEKMVLSFEVRDTGIGLTEEEAKNLFKRFSQANSEISEKYGGSGLGLTITKEIVERMGGKITIQSKLGEGTTVKFHVVSKLSASNVERQAQDKKKRRLEVEASTASHGLGRSILVVEDNSINSKLLKKILEGAGYHVEIAVNGKEAWERVTSLYNSRSTMFHCILMDFEMPVMNGVECTQKIRQFEKENFHGMVPIIGVSANARTAHAQTAIEIGMNSYITKPFQREDIYNAIDREAYQNSALKRRKSSVL
ncbi:serine/threonine protein kinase and signal transduction histidine kinase [Planoprotostelium fungivorum]|uniref:Serine/threonine protein kinase and signal transduction histidine kinase n=1 Tax=Planoprotostelium fungivorum TaxID=1890364 RepID=A0A2P6NWZ7_9EUKA|nr:serine/threonine protein kinase and signal transduction histidine kinase [Planoprotostelium fungivorum]